MTLAGLGVRNLARNKFRAGLTVFSVAVAILAFLLLRTLLSAWVSGAERVTKERLVTRSKTSFLMELPRHYVEDVRSTAHVILTTWENFFAGKDPQHPTEFFTTLAVDSSTFFDVYDQVEVSRNRLETWKHDKGGAIVGDVLAKKLGWNVGDKVILQSGLYPGDWQFDIDAIYTATSNAVDRSAFYVHWDYVNDLRPPERRDTVLWIVSRVDDPTHVADIGVALDKRFEVLGTPTLSQDEHAFTMSFVGMYSTVFRALDVISAVILVIMALVVGNTIAMGVRERTTEYGVLRALGFSPWHVALWVVGESLAMGGLGGVVGLAIAWPFINFGVGRFVEENAAAFFPSFRLDAGTALLGLGLAAALGAAAAAVPAWQASRLRVVDAVRRVA